MGLVRAFWVSLSVKRQDLNSSIVHWITGKLEAHFSCMREKTFTTRFIIEQMRMWVQRQQVWQWGYGQWKEDLYSLFFLDCLQGTEHWTEMQNHPLPTLWASLHWACCAKWTQMSFLVLLQSSKGCYCLECSRVSVPAWPLRLCLPYTVHVAAPDPSSAHLVHWNGEKGVGWGGSNTPQPLQI